MLLAAYAYLWLRIQHVQPTFTHLTAALGSGTAGYGASSGRTGVAA